jgi:hypothetical protein
VNEREKFSSIPSRSKFNEEKSKAAEQQQTQNKKGDGIQKSKIITIDRINRASRLQIEKSPRIIKPMPF